MKYQKETIFPYYANPKLDEIEYNEQAQPKSGRDKRRDVRKKKRNDNRNF
jgi:hypothetical protein